MKKYSLFILLILSFFKLSAQEEEANPTALEDALIGEHMFGVQFIWDGYGTAEILKNDEGELVLYGEQYSSNKEEFVLLEGKIVVSDDRNFTFNGHIKLFTKECCGLLDREVSYTFRKTGSRKYWRLKERDNLCSPTTCAYHLDIFE